MSRWAVAGTSSLGQVESYRAGAQGRKMAVRIKGWRRIVLEGQIFFWQAEASAGWNLFQARPETESHRRLIVTCGQCGNQTGGFFRGASPGIVRACIESAIKAGWLAERPVVRQVAFSDPHRCVTI